MTANIISPYPYFTDTTGAALDAGSIYIGVAGADPRTSPVTVYQDEAGTVTWAQPLRTVLGYAAYQGSPARIFVSAPTHSIMVFDSRGREVFRNLSVGSFALLSSLASTAAGGGIDLVSRVPYPVPSRTALKALDTTRYQVAILYEAGRAGVFNWTAGNFTTRIAVDTREGVFVKADAISAGSGAWVRQYDELTPEMFGAVADGTSDGGGTDNTAAIQGIFNLFDYLTNRVVRFTGVYTVSTETSRIGGNLTRTLECWSDNARLLGPGTIVGKNTTAGDNNWRFMLFGGAGKIAAGTGNITTQRCIDKTGPAITASIPEGGRTVTVAAGDEAGFAAGDVVFIRTGQLLSTGLTEPKAELAIVASTASGSITLTRPTTHDYAQEYFISGTSGLTSTAVTANPARYEIVNVTDRVQRDLFIGDGLKFRYAAQPGTWSQCVSLWGILGLNLDCELSEYPAAGLGWRDSSDAVLNIRLRHNGVLNTTYGFHPSTGCTRIYGSVYQTSAGFNTFQLHESVGDVALTVDLANVGGVGETFGGLNISNRGRNIRLDASVDIGVSTQNAIQNIDGTDMKNVVIEAIANGNVRDDSGQIRFIDRGITGRRSFRGLQADAANNGSVTEVQALTCVIDFNRPSSIMGYIPQDAFPVRVHVSVFQALSGGTSTRIRVGFDGGTGVEIVNDAICNTSGDTALGDRNNRTILGGGTASGLGAQRGSGANLVAAFTGTGCTAGSVTIVVEYIVPARRD